METGYSWDKTLPDNTPGQLAHNGPYPDFSPLGQKNFMLELIKEIKQAKDCRILGFLYWDPIFIEVEGMGWELGAKNYVSNTTLFDLKGIDWKHWMHSNITTKGRYHEEYFK